MMKGQKGITLVALIITIIVMLILVGVSISVALNGGLFTKARTANEETRAAQVKEAMALAKADILSEYYDPTTPKYQDAAPTNKNVEDAIKVYLDDKTAPGVTVGEPSSDATGTTYEVTATGIDLKTEKTIKFDLWKTTTP